MRFLTELRCEKLRPELFRLTEHLDYQAPSAAVAAQSHPSIVAEAGVAGRQATEPRNKGHWRVSSRSPQARRHARRAAPNLPPILLALFGETPRNSTAFRRTSGGPSGGRGGVRGGGAAGGVAHAARAPRGGSGGGEWPAPQAPAEVARAAVADRLVADRVAADRAGVVAAADQAAAEVPAGAM